VGALEERRDPGRHGPREGHQSRQRVGLSRRAHQCERTLFFKADDGVHGYELWKSDGTEGGTVLVKDIDAGSESGDPWYLTNVNGTLFFNAWDGVHGYELWKSNGTDAGTVLVKDIYPGSEGGMIPTGSPM